jgi:cellulose synthase/poly-beta-1,6-N-acetylglucosamine synthase-like glycosyltransferase
VIIQWTRFCAIFMSLKELFWFTSMPENHTAAEAGSNAPESLAVDVIIPVYNERPEALAATLSACTKQTRPVHKIFVVDDGSRLPFTLPAWAEASPQFCLLRLPQNQGISAARNAAISRATSAFLACVNTEVLPDPDWVANCSDYLVFHPQVGACYARTVPENPDALLTRWRMRFQEPKCLEETGPSPFAHGHAVFFRRSALEAVGGYDVRFRVANEDADISKRLWEQGWEVHFLAASRCVSIQKDTVRALAIKQLRDSGWSSPAESSLMRLYLHLTKWTAIRAGRNLAKARLSLLPVDVALWAYALGIATAGTVKYRLSSA